MRRLTSYLSVFVFISVLFISCGKETSEVLISFDPQDVVDNGNAFNEGCLDCELFTWCDNSQYTYAPTGLPSFTLKYKNVSRITVGGIEFTGTLVQTRDTVYHNCQNNITRILTANRQIRQITGSGVVGETWTENFGDSVFVSTTTAVDVPVTVLTKTFNSTVTVIENKYNTNGSTNPTDWELITKTENVYARDRIGAVRIAGVGLIKRVVTDVVGGGPNFQLLLKSYSLP
jgi:hypothetical protein